MSKVAKQNIGRALRPGVRYVAQRIGLFLVFAVILFAAAGRLSWLRAWVYLLYGILMEAGTLFILTKRAPETLNHRGTWQAGVKIFDKVFAVAWLTLSLITPIVAGLDERLRLSSMPMTALYVGAVLLTVGYVFATWAMVENKHFEQFVRIQVDRAHRVVTSGPYQIVRHPGYAGAILGALCTPLILGSWWTCVPAGAVALLFIIRTVLEDGTLRKELEGYEAYARRTRYRLFPGLW
jgi:protein-S-isoprenylcysteine O-methyltransferase Ste14